VFRRIACPDGVEFFFRAYGHVVPGKLMKDNRKVLAVPGQMAELAWFLD
jgi:hypothetical protein